MRFNCQDPNCLNCGAELKNVTIVSSTTFLSHISYWCQYCRIRFLSNIAFLNTYHGPKN